MVKTKAKKIHFVGIGGEGMSALALVLRQRGWAVSGSDLHENQKTQILRQHGVKVAIGHRPENLDGAPEVVFSSAVSLGNVELQVARERGRRVVHRLELLGRLMIEHFSIGVTGTHGKSTTAAMIAFLLTRAGLDPTFLLGASCPALGGNAYAGMGKHLVAEIDESDGRFVGLQPELAVITNIGIDHLNNYGSAEALYRGFAQFAARAGRLVLNADDPGSQRLIVQACQGGPQPLLFGIEKENANEADLRATDIRHHEAWTSFKLVFRGKKVREVLLPAPGRHNVYNALAALLVGWWLGLDLARIGRALREFILPKRRFQILKQGEILIVDDYAHLPEEVAAGLQAARHGWRPRRLIALFQPHRFSRISYINGRFARALDEADLVLLTEVYPAGERPLPGVTARLIQKGLSRPNRLFTDHQELIAFLRGTLRPGDFLISFNAGDLWEVSHRLARQL